VQYVIQNDGELCIELTVYSGNPNASAADIVKTLKNKPPSTFTMQTNRLKDFAPCEDEANGCIEDSSGDSLLWIIIGVAAFCLLLLLAIVWYCLHKRVGKQYKPETRVAADVRMENTAWQA
jgi:hypothetical protein